MIQPSLEQVKDRLAFDRETGDFTWTNPKGRKLKPGVRAGCVNSTGYVVICFEKRRFYAHRLAWLFEHGKWPSKNIDHINGNRQDNRAVNLRDVSQLANAQNQRVAQNRNKSCGLLGVSPSGRLSAPWQAQITANGKHIPLGRFADPQVAHEAYLKAKRELHEGCTI